MNQFAATISEWSQGMEFLSILFLLIKFTLLVAFVLLLYRLQKNRSASFRHAVLGTGVLAVPVLIGCHFLFPAWGIPVPKFVNVIEKAATHPDVESSNETIITNLILENEAALALNDVPQSAGWVCNPDQNNAAQTEAVDRADENELRACSSTSTVSTVPVAPKISIPWATILCSLWISGAILLLSRLSLAWCLMGWRVRKADQLSMDELQESGVPRNLVRSLQSKGIRVKISQSSNQMPMGIGLFRKTILLPASCRSWSRAEMQSVMLHEQAHFHRGDVWLNLVARIQQAVLWFHPLSSLLVRKIRHESEFACDDRVIQSGISRFDYAEVLMQIASRGRYQRTATLTGVTMSEAMPLESRMKSILSENIPRHQTGYVRLSLLACMMCLVLAPIATARLFQTQESSVAATLGAPESSLDLAETGMAPIEQTLEEGLLNVTFKPSENDTTYGGELVGTSEDSLQIQTSDGPVEVPLADVQMLVDSDGKTHIQKTDGTIVTGILSAELITFTIDGDHVGDGEMTRSVDPTEIYLVKRVQLAELVAETITDGVATSKLTYHLRAPTDYDETKQYPAIVLLHQNRSNAKSYVDRVVRAWPEIAERYVLIGINGERPAWSSFTSFLANPTYNYTGLSFVGRGSNFRGFDGTDRESPAPVAEAITELRQRFDFTQLFVAGHGTSNYTSGGNLAYHIQTYFPEICDGVAVLAGASLVQCNVVEFDDEEMRKNQRSTPLVIVDGEKETGSKQGYADWAYKTYLDNSFSMLKYLQNGAGASFSEMPFDQAITWLEQITEKRPEEAITLAEKFVVEGNMRDAIVLLNRVEGQSFKDEGLLSALQAVQQAVQKGVTSAERFEKCLAESTNSDEWYDEFVEFRKTWEFADGSNGCMSLFNRMRSEQKADAKKIFTEARNLDRTETDSIEESTELYRQVVEKYFASRYYRQAKSILDRRDEK